MEKLQPILRIIDKLSSFVGATMSILLPALTLVLSFEVVARYFFKRPTIWSFDLSIFMFGYCGLLSGAYVLKEKEHISVDIICSHLSKRCRAILEVVMGLLFFFFIIITIVYGWEAAYSALSFGDRRPTEWAPPNGHFKLMLPLGALLLLLQGLSNWIRSLYLAIHGKEMMK